MGEKIFRGVNYGKCKIESGGKLDWRLIPKHEEHKWLDAVTKCEQRPKPIVISTGTVPSLMAKIYHDEKLAYEIPLDKQSVSTYELYIRKGKFNTAVFDKKQTSNDEKE